MSTKATTTRLTFGPTPGDRTAAETDAAAAAPDTETPPAAQAPAAETAESTPAGARRGAPSDRPGRKAPVEQPPGEIGGGDRPEPTRYGDWEVGGRCTDF
jgi:hypothetical protein